MTPSRTAQIAKPVSCFLFGIMLLGSVLRAEVPAFVSEPFYTPNAAPVAEVVSMDAADVVFLDGGLQEGLRLGMVCRVLRGDRSIGELIIIESQADRAAGLILNLVADSTIQAGDVARIKTIQNS